MASDTQARHTYATPPFRLRTQVVKPRNECDEGRRVLFWDANAVPTARTFCVYFLWRCQPSSVTTRSAGGIDMSPTVQRFYKVFISSTFLDLANHRQQAELGILKAGHMPVALENYSPDSESKRTVISNALASCQFYVIILGYRYGSIPEDQSMLPPELQDKSYTEIELDLAQAAGLPVLPFILNNDEVAKGRKSDEWINSSEPRNIEKYENLRRRLTAGIHKPFAKPFAKPEDIHTELYAIFKSGNKDVRGYILEPESGSDVDVILRFSSGNRVARDVVEALGKFSDVDPRLAIAPRKKEALAEAFLQLHGEHIQGSFSRVFFESWSTLTYLARSLSDKLPKRGKTLHSEVPVNVLTNNAFAYLYLWLCSGVMCHPVPEGPPDHTYGGMYGPLTERNRRPDYKLPALERYDNDAYRLIGELKSHIFPELSEKRPSLILAAASGLQLSDNVATLELSTDPATMKERWVQSNDIETTERVRKCRGFHVGSYQNMLFKRCYYLAGIPSVVFIHDDKIDCEVKVGKCHYLFDQGTPWEQFASEYPLSIWVACERSTYQGILNKCRTHFSRGEWTFAAYGESNPYPIVIGHNKSFRETCQRVNVSVFE
jgi:hypothetical protein